MKKVYLAGPTVFLPENESRAIFNDVRTSRGS
jgi:hypothetical protein